MIEPITDWDDAYANGAYIHDAESFPLAWARDAEAFRKGVGPGHSRESYGAGSRQWLDLFQPDGAAKGLAVFVHGGYWMKFDAGLWSHLAAGALARGWAVALPTYTLAPEAGISEISAEVADVIGFMASRVSGPIALAGHSAGGHLVTRQVCNDTALAPEVRSRIAHVLSISGVHDLRPLMATAMNATLRLDAQSANAESPALGWPDTDARVTCWVGAAERPEFRRQTALLANAWTGAGVAIDAFEAPEKHHFDVIDALTDPESALVARWLG